MPTKKAFVATVVAAAQKLGLPLRNAQGAPEWGGHAMRRGGAQHLAAAGVLLHTLLIATGEAAGNTYDGDNTNVSDGLIAGYAPYHCNQRLRGSSSHNTRRNIVCCSLCTHTNDRTH